MERVVGAFNLRAQSPFTEVWTTVTTEMKYGRIAGIEKPISRLMQGTIMTKDSDQEKANDLLDAVVEMGCNCFDSAHNYGGGGSERALGNWMEARGNRQDIVIMTKGCHQNKERQRVTPEDLDSDLKDSLERLKSDYIDIYVLHRDDPGVPVGPIVETFNKHFTEGKIHAFGGSNWTYQRIAEANEYAEKHGLQPFTVTSPNYSLAVQVESPWGNNCVSISGPQGADARNWYTDHRIPIFAWSSMARGFFSGRWNRENYEGMKGTPDASSVHAYCHEENWQRLDRVTEFARKKGVSVAQMALAWVLKQPMDLYALVGCWNPQEFADCVEALHLELSDREVAWLDLQDG